MTEGFCLTQGNVIILFDTKILLCTPKFIFHFLLLRHSAFVHIMAVPEKFASKVV